MSRKTFTITATSLAAAAAIALGGAAIASADNSSSTGSSVSTSASSTQPGAGQAGQHAQRGQGNQQGHRMGPHEHTAVTGDEAQKVIDAVAAANEGVSITEVEKDPDGSYDAKGTNAEGAQVRFDVSADLATITEGGKGGMRGGPGGGGQHTAVTGDEAQKVKDAVAAANDGVTIVDVRKDPDGSYDALGTTADGSKVMFDVSADLATITEHTHAAGQRGPGPDRQGSPEQGSSNDAPTVAPSPGA